MNPTHLTLATAIAVATLTGAAQARPEPASESIVAIYNQATERFCIRPQSFEAVAEVSGPRVYRAACRTQQQWRSLGVVFPNPSQTSATLRS